MSGTMIDLNKDVESPCEQIGWGFVGFVMQGRGSKRKEVAVPIGAYSRYRDGAAHANAWMMNTPNAIRWEGERLYKTLEDDE